MPTNNACGCSEASLDRKEDWFKYVDIGQYAKDTPEHTKCLMSKDIFVESGPY